MPASPPQRPGTPPAEATHFLPWTLPWPCPLGFCSAVCIKFTLFLLPSDLEPWPFRSVFRLRKEILPYTSVGVLAPAVSVQLVPRRLDLVPTPSSLALSHLPLWGLLITAVPCQPCQATRWVMGVYSSGPNSPLVLQLGCLGSPMLPALGVLAFLPQPRPASPSSSLSRWLFKLLYV